MNTVLHALRALDVKDDPSRVGSPRDRGDKPVLTDHGALMQYLRECERGQMQRAHAVAEAISEGMGDIDMLTALAYALSEDDVTLGRLIRARMVEYARRVVEDL